MLIPSDSVILFESMKMEIPVEAGVAGTINEIMVNIGDFVNEEDVLLTIDQ